MAKENTALTVITEYSLPAVAGEVAQGMQEEMEGIDPKFRRVKVPSGGGLMWEMPNPDDEDPVMAKELLGIIVDHHPINAFWRDAYDGKKNPPDCSSLDGRIGTDRETGEMGSCADCPHNQWGSDPKGTGGKACKNMRRVYLMMPGNMFPLILAVPPTSLGAFSDFIQNRIAGRGRRSYDVLTKIALKKEKNKGGIGYSQCVFGITGTLSDELKKQAKAYSNEIKKITRTIQITEDEYSTTEEQRAGSGGASHARSYSAPPQENHAYEDEAPF
jgi:hypothetical protein